MGGINSSFILYMFRYDFVWKPNYQTGVGDAKELSQHGIPLVQDTPLVGKNLQDHIFAHVPFKVNFIFFIPKKYFLSGFLNINLMFSSTVTQ